ncbi:hypothetical protein V6N11_017386 [Hibiscus sabdariffa]|uniref:Uncharacterized protein n=1 Tax=Hibiscus sabdariffa TaxID=183260 RepID=A0ABR2TYD8_9ROSI
MARTRISILLMGLVLRCCLNTPAKSGYMKYKDPKQPIPVRIQDLLDRMALEEKIGQMVQIDCRVASVEVMKNLIGSILSGGGSDPGPQASAEDWINMVNEFQRGTLNLLRKSGLQRHLKPGQLEFHMFLHLVCRDPRWGRCYESYSEDPQIVEDMTEIIPGLQGDIPTNSPKGIPFVTGK